VVTIVTAIGSHVPLTREEFYDAQRKDRRPEEPPVAVTARAVRLPASLGCQCSPVPS
jgi:hypothetical protein